MKLVPLILGDASRGRGMPGVFACVRIRQSGFGTARDHHGNPRGSTGGDYETGDNSIKRASDAARSRRRRLGMRPRNAVAFGDGLESMVMPERDRPVYLPS